MNEVLFALLLALAWFGAVNAALSAAAAGIGWFIQRGLIRLRASSAPDVLLLLKLVPGVVALFFTFVVFLPAHWRFEPEGAEESAGYTLAALGILGARHARTGRAARGPRRRRHAPGRARLARARQRAHDVRWGPGCPSTACPTPRRSSRSPDSCGRACSWRARSSRRSRATRWR